MHSDGTATSPTSGHVEASDLVAALERSVERLCVARPSTPDAFEAVFEALAWVGAIRDRFAADSRPPTLRGLYYVRNLVLHSGFDALAWLPGFAFGEGEYGQGSYGGGPYLAPWPPRDALPVPRFEHDAAAYEQHVAGREVVDVFRALVAELRQTRL